VTTARQIFKMKTDNYVPRETGEEEEEEVPLF